MTTLPVSDTFLTVTAVSDGDVPVAVERAKTPRRHAVPPAQRITKREYLPLPIFPSSVALRPPVPSVLQRNAIEFIRDDRGWRSADLSELDWNVTLCVCHAVCHVVTLCVTLCRVFVSVCLSSSEELWNVFVPGVEQICFACLCGRVPWTIVLSYMTF